MEDVWEKPESNLLSPQSDKVPLQVRNRFPSNSPWGHRFLKLVSVSHYKTEIIILASALILAGLLKTFLFPKISNTPPLLPRCYYSRNRV